MPARLILKPDARRDRDILGYLQGKAPGATCIMAQAPSTNNWGYSSFFGDAADYAQVTDVNKYNYTGVHWSSWMGDACTNTRAALCEVPAHVLYGTCPTAPPAAPPPVFQPSTGLCETPDRNRLLLGNHTAASNPISDEGDP